MKKIIAITVAAGTTLLIGGKLWWTETPQPKKTVEEKKPTVWTQEEIGKPTQQQEEPTPPTKQPPQPQTTLSTEELAELTGDDRQEALVTALTADPEIEKVGEVQEVKCEGKTCTLNIKSKTTNIDPEFQTAITKFVQKNYQWIGNQIRFDTEKEQDPQLLQYTFGQQEPQG